MVAMRARGGLVPGIALVCLALVSLPANGGGVPDGSSIRFVAKNLVATGDGTFADWRIVSSSIQPDDPMGSFVEVEVNVASIDTGNTMRDDHLRNEDFFDVETYPVAKVRVHSATLVAAKADGGQRYSAKFDIDLHGVKKTLNGEFVLLSIAPFRVEGKLVVNRVDFGVGEPQSRWNPLSITEDVPVEFRATLP